MDYGAHLPLIGFENTEFTLSYLTTFTETADRLGYAAIAANDHFVFPRPWLDGPTALAAVLGKTGQMQLATTVSLPVVRGPVSVAKILGAIDLLSGGRLIVGVGPGSSSRDYAAVGIPFEERWRRLDECILVLRYLWQQGSSPHTGRYYSTSSIELRPYPTQRSGPPIWIGSWGSDVGLRRVARLGDGWLASGYNTTPALFEESLAKLGRWLAKRGKGGDAFPNAVATMWCYVTENRREAEQVLEDVIAKMLGRPVDELRERLLVGPAEECAQKLALYQLAGAQRVFIWPVKDAIRQLSVFMERVALPAGA